MAGSLRALRAGNPGATLGLMGVCFAYGFFHAVGPGHGKVLIGGYGLGARVAMTRLAMIALVSSLAQAVTAVVLVYASVFLLGWGSKQLVGAAEDYFAPASYGAILLVGAWLILRGARKLWRARATTEHTHSHAHDHQHDHHHHHDHTHHSDVCEDCGHHHGPTVEEAANVSSLRDLLVLVGAIAMRPCTGAIFLLILTWRMGIVTAGIMGTFAMALGTASVTIAVALAAVGLRESTLQGLTSAPLLRVAVPVLELAAGSIVVIVASQLLRAAL
ncbi:nickel/cobalt efflux system [Amylibacter cionae]|uniref:Nickel/cobalt efflux system n=2 Tax=Neptunicoccus cionae TaxID=2035344 RepID=A0A916VLT6_9RHOB|nr:nickel/cobalt efflux system [Amylibacter cionae]